MNITELKILLFKAIKRSSNNLENFQVDAIVNDNIRKIIRQISYLETYKKKKKNEKT
jgi:hypothetical protein